MKKHTCICEICGKEFKSGLKTKKICSDLCLRIYSSRKKYPDNADTNNYVECKICGFRGKELLQHISAYHMSIKEYCEKFNCSRYDLICENMHKKRSATCIRLCSQGKVGWIKGGKNPAYSSQTKSGRNSAWSMNFKGYAGLTDEEKKRKIKELSNKVVLLMNSNHNNPLRVDYYTSRGYSLREAKKMLKERQQTFSLEKCIKKYGKNKGLKVFNERQKKWQNTLASKPIEEIERINAAKMMNGVGYSMISQQLFKQLHKIIHNEYSQIFYATVKNNESFNEFHVYDSAKNKSYFLDFYVKDNNKVIEFDGDYWHSEKHGSLERDKEREEHLKQLGYLNILHVKECDYRKNPKQVIEKCVNFIRN